VGFWLLACWDYVFESRQCMSLCCLCIVMSDWVLFVGLVFRPEESYRQCCVQVVWSRNHKHKRSLAGDGPQIHKRKKVCWMCFRTNLKLRSEEVCLRLWVELLRVVESNSFSLTLVKQKLLSYFCKSIHCATYVRMFLFFCCDCWHKPEKFLKYLLYPKWPYPLHVQLLAALCRVCLQGSPGSLLISPNYWIWRMCVLACSWTIALR